MSIGQFFTSAAVAYSLLLIAVMLLAGLVILDSKGKKRAKHG